MTATKANQPTLTVTGAPGSAGDGQTFTVGYSGGAGTGAVTFAVTGGICTVSGTQVTMTASSGTCSITVTQAGDNNYNAATSARRLGCCSKWQRNGGGELLVPYL